MTAETDWKPKVEKIIRHNFSAAHGRQLVREMKLRGDDGLAGFDLDVIQAVMDLEDAFGIEITDGEDGALLTVGDVFDLVERKLVAHADL